MQQVDKYLEALNDYFVSKLLSRSYELSFMGRYLICLKVDGKYKFTFWVANTRIEFRQHTYFDQLDTMELSLTERQKDIIWHTLEQHYDNRMLQIQLNKIKLKNVEAPNEKIANNTSKITQGELF